MQPVCLKKSALQSEMSYVFNVYSMALDANRKLRRNRGWILNMLTETGLDDVRPRGQQQARQTPVYPTHILGLSGPSAAA